MGLRTDKSSIRLNLERLEEREVLSGYQPSNSEQLFLEILNDARANPAAYGQSIGLNLNGVAPSQPLAFDTRLIEAARRHATDMSSRSYFAHSTPEGVNPGQRISAAGYVWNSWGESLAAGSAYPGPYEALRALIIDEGIPDLGHRRHLLAMDSIFQGQTQAGIGIVQNTGGPYTNYYTIDSASQPGGRAFVTGVVTNDYNNNGRYDAGEGLGNVSITIAGVGTVTSFSTGGYSLPVSPGVYTVTASGGALASPVTRTVTVGSQNVRLNFAPGSDNYVQKIYQYALGRAAGPSEVTFWMSVVQGPAGLLGLANGIELSAEARTRLVKSWYANYLGRPALNGEEQVFVNGMLQGASEENVLTGIMASDEYVEGTQQRYSGIREERYITGLYQSFLGRTPSAGELAGWVQTLDTVGRVPVVSAFNRSVEFRANVVRSYYANLLNRAPSSNEVLAWVYTPLSLLHIRQGFETSREFFANG